jgi:hypothetical protein
VGALLWETILNGNEDWRKEEKKGKAKKYSAPK